MTASGLIPSALTAALLLLLPPVPAGATEEPAFRLIAKSGSFELREYPPLLAAETVVAGAGFEDAADVAFGRLFGYISGNNRSRTEIAMTVPVVQSRADEGEKIAMTAPVIQQGDAGTYRVAFLVPVRYTAETVPEPLDPSVRIVATPARLVAVRRYSGRTSAESYRAEEARLMADIANRGLEPAGGPISAQYDAPFIPGPFRRNEVLVPVKRPD